jgi:glycerophosphoryl diester phosphodiesterase
VQHFLALLHVNHCRLPDLLRLRAKIMIQQIDPLNRVIVAHRGVSGLFPENTRRAFEASVACGADAIEFDIQITADEHIVICHDPTLKHYGYPDTRIGSSTLEQLQSVDIGRSAGRQFSGERLLTLPELLQDFGSRIPMYVEFKTKHMVADQIDALIDGFLRQTAVGQENWNLHALCFDKTVLGQLHEKAAWLPLVWNTNKPHLIRTTDLTEQPWLAAVGCRIGHLTQQTAKLIDEAGLRLFSFTCNDEADVLKAVALGTDSVITDDPEKTRRILAGEQAVAPVPSRSTATPLQTDHPQSPTTP